jgi:hypothetical protein
MELTRTDQQKLLEDGWLELRCGGQINLLNVARQLGKPVPSRRNAPLIDRLMPTKQEDAHPRSLSAVYGIGEFPFHTDSAYIPIPPRFMLLHLIEGTSDRPTLLHDVRSFPFTEEEKRVMLRDVWLVNGGRGRFFTSLMNDTLVPGITITRYDQCCMRPAHRTFGSSSVILNSYCRETDPYTVNWAKGLLLILDNWRILHARGRSSDVDNENRVLERVLVAVDEEIHLK